MAPTTGSMGTTRQGWRAAMLAVALIAPLSACSDGDDPTPAEGNGGTGALGGSGGAGGVGLGGNGGTGGTAPGPNCDGLPDNCGPNADEDCCLSPVVPGGTFLRSYDGIAYTDDTNPATVSTFALDRFEVTVGRFRAFVEAGKGTQASPPAAGDGAHPLIADSGWDAAWTSALSVDSATLSAAIDVCDAGNSHVGRTWTDAPGASESLPMNCMSWYEALAFCAWDGGWLPTEAEWNYAAAGGEEQRSYPWSTAYPPGSTTIDETYAIYECLGDGAPSCTFANLGADLPAVGSRSPKGDSRWGQADLGGSMWEWTRDGGASYPNPCEDCANLTGSDRWGRGGHFYNHEENVLVGKRLIAPPEYRNFGVGFRCARAQ